MWLVDYLANGMGWAYALHQAGFYNILPMGIKHYTDARIELMFSEDK